jgi:hypothetical protein
MITRNWGLFAEVGSVMSNEYLICNATITLFTSCPVNLTIPWAQVAFFEYFRCVLHGGIIIGFSYLLNFLSS